MRDRPTTAGKRVGSLGPGEPVEVIGPVGDGKWLAVTFDEGRAYVARFLVSPERPSPPPPEVVEGPAKVLDTANLLVNGKLVKLLGIEGLDGAPALNMEKYILQQGGRLRCSRVGTSDYVCQTKTGLDLAEAALLNGAARTVADAPPRYLEQERQARRQGRGIWSDR